MLSGRCSEEGLEPEKEAGLSGQSGESGPRGVQMNESLALQIPGIRQHWWEFFPGVKGQLVRAVHDPPPMLVFKGN